MDLRQLIDNTRMSGYQWLIIAVAAFVNAVDGYDLVAMAFSANAVTEEFDLSGSTLGWLLASALIGVGVGAVALDTAGFAVSSGSACRAGQSEPSPVLLAMGYSPELAQSALRFTLPSPLNEAEIEQIVRILRAEILSVRPNG